MADYNKTKTPEQKVGLGVNNFEMAFMEFNRSRNDLETKKNSPLLRKTLDEHDLSDLCRFGPVNDHNPEEYNDRSIKNDESHRDHRNHVISGTDDSAHLNAPLSDKSNCKNNTDIEKDKSNDARFNDENLDSQRAKMRNALNETSWEDGVSPALQISQTFSLATLDRNSSPCPGRSHLLFHKNNFSDDVPETYESAGISDSDYSFLNHENDHNDINFNNDSQSQNNDSKATKKTEKRNKKEKNKTERLDDHIKYHIINLEAFESRNVQGKSLRSEPRALSRKHEESNSMNNNIMLSKPDLYPDHEYLRETEETTWKYSKSKSKTKQFNSDEDKTGTSSRRDNFGLSPHMTREFENILETSDDVSDRPISDYASHIELTTLGSTGEEASSMVVDLDESVTTDSGVFDAYMDNRKHATPHSSLAYSKDSNTQRAVSGTFSPLTSSKPIYGSMTNTLASLLNRKQNLSPVFKTGNQIKSEAPWLKYKYASSRAIAAPREFSPTNLKESPPRTSLSDVTANSNYTTNRTHVSTNAGNIDNMFGIYQQPMKTGDPYILDDYLYRNHPYQFASDPPSSVPIDNHLIPPSSGWEPWSLTSSNSLYSTGSSSNNLNMSSALDSSCTLCIGSYGSGDSYSESCDLGQCSSMHHLIDDVKDEEETDDADETGQMEFASYTPSHCSGVDDHYSSQGSYSTERFTPASLTPPPSTASTPLGGDTGHGIDDMSPFLTPWTSASPFAQISHNFTAPYDSFPLLGSIPQPLQAPFDGHLAPEQLDAVLLSHGLQRGTKRPFPSMADKARAESSRYMSDPPPSAGNHLYDPLGDGNTFNGNFLYQYTPTTNKRKRGGGRGSHKNQIQSDKISTSSIALSNSFGAGAASTIGGNSTLDEQGIERHSILHHSTTSTGSAGWDVPGTSRGSGGNRTVVQRTRPRHNEPLNEYAVNVMASWYNANIEHPYPTKAQKQAMAREGQITENQVKSWFANKRNRTDNTKPKVQKRAMQEKLKLLFKDLKSVDSSSCDNTHIIQQLSGIIKQCHVKVE